MESVQERMQRLGTKIRLLILSQKKKSRMNLKGDMQGSVQKNSLVSVMGEV